MVSIIKDGWHIFYGMEVYVENGRVIRGLLNGKRVHPFRKGRRAGEWDGVSGISVSAWRAGMNRGTIIMFEA